MVVEWKTTCLAGLRRGNIPLTERTQTVSVTFRSDDGTSSACLLSRHAEYFSTHWESLCFKFALVSHGEDSSLTEVLKQTAEIGLTKTPLLMTAQEET